MRGVFLDVGSLYPADLDLADLRAALPAWDWFDNTPPEQMAARIADAEVVVSNKAVLTASVMATARRLRLVCVAATGTNNVDVAAATQHGIAVCNVPDYATPSVVQHTFALLLALREHLLQYSAAVARGEWQRSAFFSWLGYPFEELRGHVLGVVGYGATGQGVAQVGHAFGMDVRVAALPGRAYGATPVRVSFAQFLQQADVLSLHCPLTPSTRHLIDAGALAQMKRSALLINTARGGLIDEAALITALREGRIAGAALDVVNEEPPSSPHCLLDAGLPNLIVTPHIAWGSRASRQRLVNELALNIRSFLQGVERNRVNQKQ